MSDDPIRDPEQPQDAGGSGAEPASDKKQAADASPPAQGDALPATVDNAPAADDRYGRSAGWGRRELFKAMASVPVLGSSCRCHLIPSWDVKTVLGETPVHEDGSAHFLVQADKNIFFQALDENYMALQHMPTFVNLMPGERRSCVGCHEPRRNAPSAAGSAKRRAASGWRGTCGSGRRT